MKKLPVILLLSASCFSMTACGVQVVSQNTTGIKKTLGKVSDEGLPPGMYFYNPFISSISVMDNHTLLIGDKSNVFTKDIQQANISWALNYHLKVDASVKMYKELGYYWQDIILPQIINGAMKNTIGTWNAVDLVSNRDKAAANISAAVAKELEPYGVEVNGFQLVDIQYDPEFDTAVKEKVIAIQKAEQAQNETVQVSEVAKQTVITATAAAQAMKIKSEALAQNQNLVAYEAVQKWDGHYPQVMSGSGGMMFNMPLPPASK